MISWTLVGHCEIRLTAHSAVMWTANELAREEVRKDCRTLASVLGGPITVTDATGKTLEVVGVHGGVES